MLRKVLCVSLLSISLTAFAQVSAPPTANLSAPSVVLLPGGYGAPAGGVLLNTPSASFAPPPNTAGISNSGRAGISESAPSNGVQAGVPVGSYVYVPYYAYPAVGSPATGATEQPSERANNELLPSYATNNVGTPVNGNGPSLAEFAARFQRHPAPQMAKTITNADIPRENAGRLTPILVAEGKLPADAQGSPTLMASNSAPPLRNVQPATTARGESATQTQSQPENSSSQLPASATILPLLGMLGLASSGLGMLLRKRR